MKIRTKLIGTFLGFAGVCAAVGGVGMYGLSRADRSMDEVSQVRLPAVASLLQLQRDAMDVMVSIRTLLSFDLSPEARQRQYANIAETRTTYEEAWAIYEELPKSVEAEATWKEFTQAWDRWRDENNRFVSLVRQVETLDVGNPVALRAMLEASRADHLDTLDALRDAEETGVIGEAPVGSTVCRIGAWLRQVTTSNTEMAAAIEKIRVDHDGFHAAATDTHAALNAGDAAAVKVALHERLMPLEEEVVGHIEEMIAATREAEQVLHQATEQVLGSAQAAGKKAQDLLGQLVEINRKAAAETVSDGEAATARSRTLAMAAMVLGVLAAIGIGLIVARGILRPLQAMMERVREIAEGDGDLTARLNIASRDEVGQLAQGVDQFIATVHDIVAQVKGATHEVAGAATQIAASSEEVAQGMSEQTAQVTQISAAIEEMAQSVVEVARKSGEAAQAADGAGETATEGGAVVEQTVADMDAISTAVGATAASVEDLGKRGEQIGAIVEVINDIADQTNLLALNAAIEAARAGEHGRGFAVVADEVRKLADRTTKATEEIAQSIQAIQHETGQAVERMNTGRGQVDSGVARAREAGESLQRIVTAARSVSEMVASIAAAAEQQSAAGEEVSRNIESISASAQQASQGTAQAAAAATQLSAKAEQLQALVGRFKTGA